MHTPLHTRVTHYGYTHHCTSTCTHDTHYGYTHGCTHVMALPIGHADYGRRPMRAQARYRMGTVIGHMTQYTHVMHTWHSTHYGYTHYACTHHCTHGHHVMTHYWMHAHTIAHTRDTLWVHTLCMHTIAHTRARCAVAHFVYSVNALTTCKWA